MYLEDIRLNDVFTYVESGRPWEHLAAFGRFLVLILFAYFWNFLLGLVVILVLLGYAAVCSERPDLALVAGRAMVAALYEPAYVRSGFLLWLVLRFFLRCGFLPSLSFCRSSPQRGQGK